MKHLKISTFCFLVFSLLAFRNPPAGSCDSFEVKAEITDCSPGQDDGKIVIRATGGSGKIRYIFYRESGHPLSEDFEKAEVANLKPGNYFCVIVDDSGCRKDLELKVK